MARSRNIKPGFFSSEELGRCPIPARLLFASLWTLADRAGRLKDSAAKIKVYTFPYDPISVQEVDGWLADLDREGLIERYEIDGQKLIFVVAFSKHQNPHTKESPSLLPDKHGAYPEQAPGFSRTSAEKAPGMHPANPHSSREKTGLIPDSLIPDSLIPDSRRPAALPEPTLTESDPAYWVERFIETHPKPCDPRFVVTFCTDNMHRLGEDPKRYSAFMRTVQVGLEAWTAYWQETGIQYSIGLEKWLAGQGWKKPPAKIVAKAEITARPTVDDSWFGED